MRFPLFSSKSLGIDLGTNNCRVWSKGAGVVLTEAAVVAIDELSGRVAAVGGEAYELLGRTGTNLIAQKPLSEGVIADFLIAEAMLKYFMDRVLGASRLMRPEVMVCVPSGVTQVERRAVLEAALSAGARRAFLIEHTLAAAIGANLPIDTPVGSMIVDIGAGQVGAAVISMGGIVAAGAARGGGNRIDEAIVAWLRKNHNLVIGARAAEEIKIKIGSATATAPKKAIEARGRDAIFGLPKAVNVDSLEITQAMGPALAAIITVIRQVLEQTPPELASDIIDRGIVLCGGCAQLRNLDRLIASQMGVPVTVAEHSQECVIYGCGVALENLDTWRKLVAVR